MQERRQTTETTDQRKKSYDCLLDVRDYNSLSQLEGQIPPAEYAQRLLNWQKGILMNLETNLGERFNAQLFEMDYHLQNGRLMHPSKDESFLDSVVEGQQHRLGRDINLDHNQKRELAEVISFSAVESYFRQNPDSQETLVVQSPPGGTYGGNFIDTFKIKTEKDQVLVKLKRFAVSTSLNQHWAIAQKLTIGALDENTPNVEKDIKLKELVVKTSKSTTEILEAYLPDKNAMSLDDYENLKKIYKPYANKYIEAVMTKISTNDLEKILNAGLKFADIKMGLDTDTTNTVSQAQTEDPRSVPYIIATLENQRLRTVKTGCGIQSSSSNSKWDLISSSLFDLNSLSSSSSEDQYGTLEIHCEECGVKYNRNPGKLEAKCRHCGGTKGIAC